MILEASPEVVLLLLPLALIMILSKLMSLGAKKIGFPQVIGLLVTGLILGGVALIPTVGDYIYGKSETVNGIAFIAEIGVIIIMFSAGLETNVGAIKKTGISALVITLLGVVVPMLFGFLVALILKPETKDILDNAGNIIGSETDWTKTIFRDLFYGVILTATSVSVTIAALKELGKLNSKIGTAIVSAAILDDIIGVIILSIVLSLYGSVGGQSNESASDFVTWIFDKIFGDYGTALSISIVIIKTVLFFVFAIIVGLFIRKLFKKLTNRYDHHRRLVIFSLAVGFIYAFIAEKGFGIADITGAFFAGLILSNLKDAEYVEKKTDVTSWMLFTPVFFAKVGLSSIQKLTESSGMDFRFVIFGLLFVIAGILGKILGCGFGAKVTGFKMSDSFRCGIGMMCRAEVCLICAEKGIAANLINPNIQLFLLILILVTSLSTPILLKNSFRKEIENDDSYDYDGLVDPNLNIENNQGPSLDQ